jgi:hypothetical protein
VYEKLSDATAIKIQINCSNIWYEHNLLEAISDNYVTYWLKAMVVQSSISDYLHHLFSSHNIPKQQLVKTTQNLFFSSVMVCYELHQSHIGQVDQKTGQSSFSTN